MHIWQTKDKLEVNKRAEAYTNSLKIRVKQGGNVAEPKSFNNTI